MRIGVTGASGLVGSAVTRALRTDGHQVRRLVRREPQDADEIRWDPSKGALDAAALHEMDAVVHLAGETLEGKWDEAKRQRIRSSRVDGARLLADALTAAPHPSGRVLVCASAIGFYGDRGAEPLTESSAAGHGFLAGVSRDLEAAALLAEPAGVRVVNLRFGIVQSPDGGMLAAQLPMARRGLAARFGLGRRRLSWVSIRDVTAAVRHALVMPDLRGPVNVVAPNPVTNAEYVRTLSGLFGRSAWLSVPPVLPRLALGPFATEVLLQSALVLPTRLTESGFRFEHPELAGALRELVGMPVKEA